MTYDMNSRLSFLLHLIIHEKIVEPKSVKQSKCSSKLIMMTVIVVWFFYFFLWEENNVIVKFKRFRRQKNKHSQTK